MGSEHNVISFDAHYAKTFETEKKEIEHGKLSDITHTKHCAVKPITMSLSQSTSIQPLGPPQPGLFISHSHGLPIKNYKKDIFPRDCYAGYRYLHSSQSIDALNHSATESDHFPMNHSSDSEEDGAVKMDTMYGDEDDHHRPLKVDDHFLADLDEENEENVENKEENECNAQPIKRSTTWS